MQPKKFVFPWRMLLALAVMMAGLAFFPYSSLSAQQLGWQQYANVYQPVLMVNHASGAPGSIFAFRGSDYPPATLVNIFVDGNAVGVVRAGRFGTFDFMIDTMGGSSGTTYNVTAAVDENISASASYLLDAGQPVQPPPPGLNAKTFVYPGGITPTVTPPPPTVTPPPPTVTPPPTGCTVNCLISDNMLIVFRRTTASLRVTVVDENNQPVSGASVDVTMTLPGGSTEMQTSVTNSGGNATFAFTGNSSGSYTAQVTNITGSGSTFDASSGTTTVTAVKP